MRLQWRICLSSLKSLTRGRSLKWLPSKSQRCWESMALCNSIEHLSSKVALNKDERSARRMLKRGAASKPVIYVNEREKYQGKPLIESVVSYLQQHNCAGASVTKAVAGYGSSGSMHEAQ